MTRMGPVVKKSPFVVVRPSSPPVTADGETIHLSPYDVPLITVPSPVVFLVYESPVHDPSSRAQEGPVHEPIESVKRGLSRALVHYPAFAGRLVDGGITCATEEDGVMFLGARADCAIKDIKCFDQSLLEELAMYYADDVCGGADPLLMVQVTEFSCGGFIVGVVWNHGVADGYGFGQFLRAFGELTRGLPSPSATPVRSDASVMASSPSFPYKDLQQTELVLQDIVISSSLIDRIKDRFFAHSHGRHSCTVYEAVAAVLWQCRTRATISDLKAPTSILLVVDARKYVGANEGYYGNCLTRRYAMASSGMVANGDLMGLIEMIQSAKKRERHINSLKEEPVDAAALEGYNSFALSTGRNLGFEQVDFGGGAPARLVVRYRRYRVSKPVCFLLPLQKVKVDGVEIHSMAVKGEHAVAFAGELARLEPAMAKL